MMEGRLRMDRRGSGSVPEAGQGRERECREGMEGVYRGIRVNVNIVPN
jgi:hypothetical protein